jgi:2-amino-4-hydroxy-6-hydroxymethyldihydropteridine diphosphokinase
MDQIHARRAWVCLGLGSNVGDRAGNLDSAIDRLSAELTVEHVSSYYETDPVGFENQPLFLNAALSGTIDLSPKQLLSFVKAIEHDLGRESTFRDGPRVLDIDLLLFGVGNSPTGGVIMRTPDLTIPHARMHERGFVLVPLAEIEPHLTHPVLSRSIRDLAREISDTGVRKRTR